MPRLTSRELHAAKRRKAEKRRQEAERLRLEEEREGVERLERQRCEEERMARSQQLQERHAQLESFVDGIYTELSKLSIKWPTQPVTKLTLDQANRAICDLKELMSGENDAFINEINEFLPAGDMPEARDVVLVLKQIKQALDRMETKHRREWRGF